VKREQGERVKREQVARLKESKERAKGVVKREEGER